MYVSRRQIARARDTPDAGNLAAAETSSIVGDGGSWRIVGRASQAVRGFLAALASAGSS